MKMRESLYFASNLDIRIWLEAILISDFKESSGAFSSRLAVWDLGACQLKGNVSGYTFNIRGYPCNL